MHRQRGFTLAEVLVATAIAFIIGWLLLRLVQSTIGTASLVNQRTQATSSADRLAERLEADAASAWTVFVPDTDIAGIDNADGHELDFANEDASHRQYWWAYDYDAAAQSVTEHTYVPGGATRTVQQFPAIATFACKAFDVTAVADPASRIYDPLFANATVSPVDFDFGWGARAVGGNRLVHVVLRASGVNRDVLLGSATAPTHFTAIVQYTPPP